MGQHRKALALSCAGSPPVASRQPRWGIGDRIPQTPCVASHCVRYSFHPQSLRDSPGGALGTVFPKPLASLRTACVIPFTPSRFATAPVGHWGPYSPNPLRRFALRALFLSPPVASRQPRWGIGDRIPQTPCVASLRVCCFALLLLYLRNIFGFVF